MPLRLHYAAPAEGAEEQQRMQIEHFLDILADIALSIAHRQMRKDEA